MTIVDTTIAIWCKLIILIFLVILAKNIVFGVPVVYVRHEIKKIENHWHRTEKESCNLRQEQRKYDVWVQETWRKKTGFNVLRSTSKHYRADGIQPSIQV